jgi:putative membrane protein
MQSTVTKKAKSEGPVIPDRSLLDYVGVVLRGVAMGASDIVPGVSGGTMAFILGIYEELIDSIRAVAQPDFIQAVLKLRIKEMFQILNWKFLLSIAMGVLIAIFTLSGFLEWTLINHPVYLWSFFFGLVLASVFTVGQRIAQWTIPLGVALAAGTLLAFTLVGLVPAQTPETWWFLFLSGSLAICAMILPGVSGAFILVLLGKYQFVLSAVNQRDFVSLGLVFAGACVGIVTFAQILGWFFKRYHDYTVAVLTGLMLGSLRKIWPWKVDVSWVQEAGEYVLDSHGERIVAQQALVLPDFSSAAGLTEFALALALGLAGFAAIILLTRFANRYRDEETEASR